MCQRLPRVGLLHARHLLRRPLRHESSAVLAAFRAKIDDPIRIAITSRLCSIMTTVLPEVGQPVQDVE